MDLDANLENPPESPQPHEDLWFLRGDIVLSTNCYLFKVHKDILSRQSSVFNDMFDLPSIEDNAHMGDGIQAAIVPDVLEGLPLVNLVGDEGEDVAHLLRTVYDRQYYDRENNETPLEVTIALLVLSTKYDFKHIRKDVIKQISKQYPMTLAAYEAVNDDNADAFGAKQVQIHFPLLKALFRANVDALQPISLYACAGYTLEYCFSLAEMFSPDQFSTLVQGRGRLGTQIDKLVARLTDDLRDGPMCRNNRNCSKASVIIDLADFIGFANLEFCVAKKLVEHCVAGICTGCAKNLEDKVNARRQKIWDDIPSFFGYPGWNVLQQKLEEIFSGSD